MQRDQTQQSNTIGRNSQVPLSFFFLRFPSGRHTLTIPRHPRNTLALPSCSSIKSSWRPRVGSSTLSKMNLAPCHRRVIEKQWGWSLVKNTPEKLSGRSKTSVRKQFWKQIWLMGQWASGHVSCMKRSFRRGFWNCFDLVHAKGQKTTEKCTKWLFDWMRVVGFGPESAIRDISFTWVLYISFFSFERDPHQNINYINF